MQYIIDANNLAGKLDLLYLPDFDKDLTILIKKYFQNTNHKVILIFDTIEPLGDSCLEKNLTIIYTPKDECHPNGADDKIIELLQNNQNQHIEVITEDIEIINQIEKINQNRSEKIRTKKSQDFAKKLLNKNSQQKNNNPEIKKKLNPTEINKLNKELLEIWNK